MDATACAGDSGSSWLGAEERRKTTQKRNKVAASLDRLIATCEAMVCGEHVHS